MNKKFLSSLAVAISFVIFFIVVYLLNHNQVVAPSSIPPEATSESQETSPSFAGSEDAFKNALNLYIQRKQEGVDMTNGPCLGKIADGWVLDIAHKPRISADEKEENQCKDYLDGTAKHFIELDPDGNLLRSE